MKDTKIFIVGAGISGLIAALELELAGFSPTILEASDRVGGRIKTDEVDGFLLDRGFQVLLTAYPEAKRYLDYDSLNLREFDPGTIIMKPGNTFIIHDPLRNPAKVFSAAMSPVGTLMDKFRILKLTQSLKNLSVEQIFLEPSTSTMDYLKNYGFSSKIINYFFSPFFKGIFLENQLETSSRMFKFVFKMFAEGKAAIPEKGMGSIPRQLLDRLKTTNIRYNTKVENIEGQQLLLAGGEKLSADKIIIATQPDQVFPKLAGKNKPNRQVLNLYFTLEKSFLASPMIALVPDNQFLINNMVFLTDVSKTYSKQKKALLSVSITEPVKFDDALPKKVAIELEALSGIKAEYFHFLKSYEIANALPQIEDLKYSMHPILEPKYENCYLAGDYLLNGSVNAAMTSGRIAAEAIILSLQSSFQPTSN